MRFRKEPRHTFEDTSRKRSAVLRRQGRERERLPLLAELVAEQQPDVETVMVERAAHRSVWTSERRKKLALNWWDARERLYKYPSGISAALLRYWNNSKWFPGVGIQLSGMMDIFDRGGLIYKDGEITYPLPSFHRHIYPLPDPSDEPARPKTMMLPFGRKQ